MCEAMEVPEDTDFTNVIDLTDVIDVIDVIDDIDVIDVIKRFSLTCRIPSGTGKGDLLRELRKLFRWFKIVFQLFMKRQE